MRKISKLMPQNFTRQLEWIDSTEEHISASNQWMRKKKSSIDSNWFHYMDKVQSVQPGPPLSYTHGLMVYS